MPLHTKYECSEFSLTDPATSSVTIILSQISLYILMSSSNKNIHTFCFIKPGKMLLLESCSSSSTSNRLPTIVTYLLNYCLKWQESGSWYSYVANRNCFISNFIIVNTVDFIVDMFKNYIIFVVFFLNEFKAHIFGSQIKYIFFNFLQLFQLFARF